MTDYSLTNYKYPKLPVAKNTKLLLHSCCAPCAGDIMLALVAANIDTTIFFYNPNIHPIGEYKLRKQENIRFAKKLNIAFIDGDYDVDNWYLRTKGQEKEPERGKRCTTCFDMRFQKTAEYAKDNGFNLISSTLGISRWKNMEQINSCGLRATKSLDNLEYWTINWRKKGGSSRMIELSKLENFYQQEYCGCVYSLRDTNNYRLSQGRTRIKRGTKFYQNAIKLENLK